MLDIVPAIGVAQLMENPDFTIVQTPGTSWTGLAMNYDRPPWDNPDARMAVAKAINRERLIETAFFGLANAEHRRRSPRPSPGPTFRRKRPRLHRRSTSRKPRALAEAAGIAGAAPTIMATPDTQRAAEVLRNQLADLGLDVQFEQLQQAAWNERWLAGDFDWVINGSVADADPDDGHWNFFHSEGPGTRTATATPRSTGCWKPPASTGDQEERAELFHELQSILQADVPYAFLYHTIDITGFAQRRPGLRPDPGDALHGDGLAGSVSPR